MFYMCVLTCVGAACVKAQLPSPMCLDWLCIEGESPWQSTWVSLGRILKPCLVRLQLLWTCLFIHFKRPASFLGKLVLLLFFFFFCTHPLLFESGFIAVNHSAFSILCSWTDIQSILTLHQYPINALFLSLRQPFRESECTELFPWGRSLTTHIMPVLVPLWDLKTNSWLGGGGACL